MGCFAIRTLPWVLTAVLAFGCGDESSPGDGNSIHGGSAGAASMSNGGAPTPNGGHSAGGANGGKPDAGGHAGRSAGGAAGSTGGAAGSTGGAAGSAHGGSSGQREMPGASGKGGDEPAPSSQWANATGTLAGVESVCGNLVFAAPQPGSRRVIAGVANAGLFATDDLGKTWKKLGMAAGSAAITNRPSSLVFDPDDPDTFWESGNYEGGGVYKTTDGGETFARLGSISHNDLISVDFTDPARKTLLVGGHEQKRTLYLSTDGGENFTNIGENLPEDSHFSSTPLVLDHQTFLLGACGWGDGTCGVFGSTDAGAHWTKVSDIPAVNRPLVASDGAIYWSTIWNGGLARSTDGKTFQKISGGAVSTYPLELPDGRIVIIGDKQLLASSDGGGSWTAIGEPLPYDANGVSYSVANKTFFVWHSDCGNAVLADAIMSAGFDFEAN